jgi:hypothetical protein
MYSPKIREDLIPRIYAAAKEAGVHMTAWVNQAIERALHEATRAKGQHHKEGGDPCTEPCPIVRANSSPERS